ncbi:hypothetical protein PL371_12365 [Tenacibaculum maritimum]|nr:hypothetical protein [Tenacibaculum maritimum]MDB0612650.1 hypothetical protein [Tenacibaculum maritimum]
MQLSLVMGRIIEIKKIDNITIVSIKFNGNEQTFSSSKKRVLQTYLNGVRVEPHSEEPVFSNFYFSIEELADNFGATNAKELHNIFIEKGFFSGDSKSNTSMINQDNITKTVNIPILNVTPPNSGPSELIDPHNPPVIITLDTAIKQAVAKYINELNPPIEVGETESLYITVDEIKLNYPITR